MDIGFVWDEAKYRTVVREHGVAFYEVVAAFDDPAGFETPGPAAHENRWLWVGKTPGERLLVIVYSEQDLPLYRIITAYDAEGRWANEYHGRA
ncbi:MAG: BrnT family toxin [Blastocatellia bacterium]